MDIANVSMAFLQGAYIRGIGDLFVLPAKSGRFIVIA